MNIRGLTKFSLVDYPGGISCILFTAGCNFRCPYCQNPALVLDPESQPEITEKEFFDFLDKRRGKLDAVVVSGGEPTLYHDLDALLRRIKKDGFNIKLDSNGSRPEVIIKLHQAGLIDALGIDYKAPAAKYHRIIAVNTEKDPGTAVRKSLSYAVEQQIQIDVRTTVHRDFISGDDLATMRRELDEIGIKTWVIQQFHAVETIMDGLAEKDTFSDFELLAIARKLGGETRVRGLRGRILD